jgi:hypothetical protein
MQERDALRHEPNKTISIEIPLRLWNRIEKVMSVAYCPSFEVFLARAIWLYEMVSNPRAKNVAVISTPREADLLNHQFTREDLLADNLKAKAEMKLKLPPPIA